MPTKDDITFWILLALGCLIALALGAALISWITAKLSPALARHRISQCERRIYFMKALHEEPQFISSGSTAAYYIVQLADQCEELDSMMRNYAIIRSEIFNHDLEELEQIASELEKYIDALDFFKPYHSGHLSITDAMADEPDFRYRASIATMHRRLFQLKCQYLLEDRYSSLPSKDTIWESPHLERLCTLYAEKRRKDSSAHKWHSGLEKALERAIAELYDQREE